jgi:hypothetical protein
MAEENEKLAVLMSFITKAYNKTESELNDLISDETGVKQDAFENLLTLDSAKVKKLKSDSQTMFDKGYQKAEAEIKSKAEKSFKEKTGFNDDAENFEELLDKYVEQQAKKTTQATDDDVKKSQAYLSLEKEFTKFKGESIPKADHEKFVNEITRKEKLSKVKEIALKLRNEVNFEKADNPTVQGKRDDYFLRDITDEYDFEPAGENDFIIIKDGKRMEDEHGNLIKFSDFVSKKTAEHFVILKQSAKGSAENQNPDTKTQTGITIKDETHYAELMADIDARQAKETDPAKVIEIRKERAKLGETWMSQSKK